MYLGRLNQREKEYLIELAYYAANFNQDFSKPQQNLIENYKREIGFSFYNIEGLEFDEIVSEFKNDTVQKIVFLEIFALILSDDKFDNKEQEFMKKLQESFDINDEKKEEFYNWIEDFMNIYTRGEELINS